MNVPQTFLSAAEQSTAGRRAVPADRNVCGTFHRSSGVARRNAVPNFSLVLFVAEVGFFDLDIGGGGDAVDAAVGNPDHAVGDG